MSSRQLRKLQKQRELEALEARANESSEQSEEEVPVMRAKPSAFAGFAALGDDDEDDDNDNETPKPEDVEEREEVEERVVVATTPAPSNKSKKNKKKKKTKKATAESTPTRQSAAEDTKKKTTATTDDEIDRALSELNLSKNAGSNSREGQWTPERKAYERICELLQVNTHHLKVMSEMRRMFGRDTVATVARENEEEQAAAQRSRQRRGATQEVDLETYLKGRPGQSLPEVTLRRNPFLDGKETWPKASTDGLTMGVVEGGELNYPQYDVVEFRFEHDRNYNEKEKVFFSLVQMYDPMQLVHFLFRNPYHVATLTQVIKVAKQDQNMSLAADLGERALFTFGRVTISQFRKKIQEGKARLDCRRPENRQFFLAGYHYLVSLMHKGTYRTALEWAKLLYSMDPEDPYALIHFIHIAAIRSGESAWFIDFCDSEALDQCETAQDYIRQTLILARLQQEDKAGARALMQSGMESLPWLYSALFKALGLDVPKTIWGFTPRDPHEELYVELYIHQTKKLWDNPNTNALLKEAASSLAAKPTESSFAPLPIVGQNLARFVYLDNTPALMGLVPDNMLSASPNWEFDPLPPAREHNLFSWPSQQDPWEPSSPAALRAGLTPDRARRLQDIFERMQRGENDEEVRALAAELREAERNGAMRMPGGVGDWSDDEDDLDGEEGEEGDVPLDEDGNPRPRQPGTAPRLFNGALQAVLNAMGIGGTGQGNEGIGGSEQTGQERHEGEGDEEGGRSAGDAAAAQAIAEGRVPGAYVEDAEDSESEAGTRSAGRSAGQ